MTGEGSRRPWIVEIAVQHLALILSGFVLVNACASIVIFGRFNTDTVLAVIQEQGAARIALAQLLQSALALPMVLAGYAVWLPATRLWPTYMRVPRRAAWTLSIASLTFLLLTRSAVVTAFLIGFAGIAVTLNLRVSRWAEGWVEQTVDAPQTDGQRVLPPPAAAIAMTGGFFAALILMTSATPWLPTERVSISGEADVTGYVISDSTDTTVLIIDSPRSVERVPTDRIQGRSICRMTSDGDSVWLSPAFGLWGSSPYEKCPS